MKLLPDPSPTGTTLPPSALAVAAPLIPTGLDCSPETVKVLLAALQGLFYHTLSGDAMALAMIQARETAQKNGVTEEEFNRVMRVLITEWQTRRGRNPLKCLY